MAELRHLHLGTPLPKGHQSVLSELQAAFDAVAARQAAS
jgi:hypothetical protein